MYILTFLEGVERQRPITSHLRHKTRLFRYKRAELLVVEFLDSQQNGNYY